MALLPGLLGGALLACIATPPPATGCVPGASAACTCTNGRAGAQLCRSDRTFAPCVCEGDTDAAVPDGGAADIAQTDTPAPPTDSGDASAPVDLPAPPTDSGADASAPVDLPAPTDTAPPVDVVPAADSPPAADVSIPTDLGVACAFDGCIFTKVRPANYRTCALLRSGELYCWGDVYAGMSSDRQLRAYRQANITDAIDLAQTREVVCIRTRSMPGRVFCFGNNRDGILGAGLSSDMVRLTDVPQRVVDLTDVTEIFADAYYLYALRTDGTVVRWGPGSRSGRPQVIPELSNIARALALGGQKLCFQARDGRVFCWGYLTYFGLTAPSTTFVEIPALRDAEQLALGNNYLCARRAGAVQCAGMNDYGQLGIGEVDRDRHALATVPGLPRVVDLVGGAHHACALAEDGRVFCWGRNQSGDLGDGTTTQRASPTLITRFSDAVSLHVGGDTSADATFTTELATCAVRRSGRLLCWGSNRNGVLGDGTMTNRSTPTEVVDLPYP